MFLHSQNPHIDVSALSDPHIDVSALSDPHIDVSALSDPDTDVDAGERYRYSLVLAALHDGPILKTLLDTKLVRSDS
jgi:hypothetical protein